MTTRAITFEIAGDAATVEFVREHLLAANWAPATERAGSIHSSDPFVHAFISGPLVGSIVDAALTIAHLYEALPPGAAIPGVAFSSDGLEMSFAPPSDLSRQDAIKALTGLPRAALMAAQDNTGITWHPGSGWVGNSRRKSGHRRVARLRLLKALAFLGSLLIALASLNLVVVDLWLGHRPLSRALTSTGVFLAVLMPAWIIVVSVRHRLATRRFRQRSAQRRAELDARLAASGGKPNGVIWYDWNGGTNKHTILTRLILFAATVVTAAALAALITR